MKLPRAESSQIRGKNAAGIELRAAEVVGNLNSQQSTATGDVVMRTVDGTVGRTARADFDGRTQRATGSEPVHLRGQAGWSVDADAFEFLLPEERFSFLGKVVTKSSPDAPQPAPAPPAGDSK